MAGRIASGKSQAGTHKQAVLQTEGSLACSMAVAPLRVLLCARLAPSSRGAAPHHLRLPPIFVRAATTISR